MLCEYSITANIALFYDAHSVFQLLEVLPPNPLYHYSFGEQFRFILFHIQRSPRQSSMFCQALGVSYLTLNHLKSSSITLAYQDIILLHLS